MQSPIIVRRILLSLAALAAVGAPHLAAAAVPANLGIEGVMTSASGGPASDGNYTATVALLDAPGGNTVWAEAGLTLIVKGGQFVSVLGQKTPLTPAVLAGERFVSVQVGTDPALTAVPLRSVATALRAAVAEGLECSACIKAGHLDPALLQAYAKSTDLTALASKADLSDYVKAAALAKVAATGAYADLTGTPALADVATSGNFGDLKGIPAAAKLGAACGTGLVMKGLKADGSYECAAGGIDAAGLPKDGLDEVSNGQLTTQFTETFANAAPVTIPDNLPAGVQDSIIVADKGTATSLNVSISFTNSDVSKVRITLFDPDGASYLLYDQGKSGTALTLAFPATDKPVSGNLSTWIGKNPKGIWSITVADLAGKVGGTDGQLKSWSVQFGTLSSQKVASVGLLQTSGGLQLQNSDKHPVTCNATTSGYLYFNSSVAAFYGCNGKNFVPMSNLGVLSSCAAILAADPLSKDGSYTIDPDGLGPSAALDVYCDMTTNGGGWTMLIRLNTNDANTRNSVDTAFWDSATAVGSLSGSDDYISAAYDSLAFTQITLRYGYQGPAVVAASYTNSGNSQNLRKNLNLTYSNANPAWTKAWSSGALADTFFGPALRFRTIGNDTDYSRIWYNLVAVDQCNQGGSIGHNGDYPGNDWFWEVARGSDAPSCQHNTFRLGVGSNYDKKAWGITDVAPAAFYNQGIMFIMVR
jgi:subtilisin-like proprotein convertase family protein